MAATVAVVATVASVAGQIYSGIAGASAANDAADAQQRFAAEQESAAFQAQMLAYRNASNLEKETLEAARREDLALEEEVGESRARAAAAGVAFEEDEEGNPLNSSGSYISAKRKEGETQIDWLKKAGFNQADLIRWEGNIAKDSGVSSANYSRALAGITKDRGTTALIGGLFGAAGTAAGAFGPKGSFSNYKSGNLAFNAGRTYTKVFG